MKTPSPNFYQQRGFSLIEALVAFLILSVGMLGIASLQTISLRAGYTANSRSVAVAKVEEMVERIRANHLDPQLQDYIVSSAGGLTAPAVSCSDLTGTVVSCTPKQMAFYDVYQWKQDILRVFPSSSTATIAVGAAAIPNLMPVTVTVNWKGRDPSANGTTQMTYHTIQYICAASSC